MNTDPALRPPDTHHWSDDIDPAIESQREAEFMLWLGEKAENIEARILAEELDVEDGGGLRNTQESHS